MKASDLVKVSGQFRRYRKACSLKDSLWKRRDYYLKQKQLTEIHEIRFRQALISLDNWISRERGEQLQEINTSLSSRMIEEPVADTMAYVWEGLREPGKAQHDEFTKTVVELMDQKGRNKRVAEHAFAIAAEIAHRSKEGWFMVFNTLTVRPGAYLKVFAKESTAFRRYIEKVEREVAISGWGNIRDAKDEEYHRYFAVVEEGGKFGRLHIHVLHIMRFLPKGARDGNKGRKDPTLRELSCFKRYWPWGHSSPIAVRYSHADAFGTANYRWPMDRRTGKGLVSGSPLKVASYLTKYITKSYASSSRSNYQWRVRKSHKLGRRILSELLKGLSPRSLLAIATEPALAIRLNNTVVPPEAIRLEALRSLQSQNSESSKTLYNTAMDIPIRPSLLTSLRDSTQKTEIHSQQNSTLLTLLQLDQEGTFELARRELEENRSRVDTLYFPRTNEPYTAQHKRAQY